MYSEPMTVAVRSEIEAPKYIDFQAVWRADGLNRFHAIALPSSSCELFSCVSSSSSDENAFMTLTLGLQAIK